MKITTEIIAPLRRRPARIERDRCNTLRDEAWQAAGHALRAGDRDLSQYMLDIASAACRRTPLTEA